MDYIVFFSKDLKGNRIFFCGGSVFNRVFIGFMKNWELVLIEFYFKLFFIERELGVKCLRFSLIYLNFIVYRVDD